MSDIKVRPEWQAISQLTEAIKDLTKVGEIQRERMLMMQDRMNALEFRLNEVENRTL